MTTWADLTSNWGQTFFLLQTRFPYLNAERAEALCKDRVEFEGYLAQSHNLSQAEAHEAIEDFLSLPI